MKAPQGDLLSERRTGLLFERRAHELIKAADEAPYRQGRWPQPHRVLIQCKRPVLSERWIGQ